MTKVLSDIQLCWHSVAGGWMWICHNNTVDTSWPSGEGVLVFHEPGGARFHRWSSCR